MAEVVLLRPNAPEAHTRRRSSIRMTFSRPSVLALPPRGLIERRKKKPAGFDVAAALEANLDRYPKKEEMWQLLTLDAAKREKLAERFPDYVKALERAIVVVSKAPSTEHAIALLHARGAAG
jgi:hypothetical protein